MLKEPIDLLEIKIEKAKRELPLETVNAINAVDWKVSILGLRERKGYTFEQLGDLELETELALCGLVAPEDYPRELENRMGISRAATDELVNEMNNLVFKKIREELIKNTERKKIFQKNSPPEEYPAEGGGSISPSPLQGEGRGEVYPPRPDVHRVTPEEGNKTDIDILDSAGIKIIPEKLEIGTGEESPAKILPNKETEVKEINPLLAQKLSSSFQVGVVKTEHSLDNITKANAPDSATIKTKIPNIDPYRELPE